MTDINAALIAAIGATVSGAVQLVKRWIPKRHVPVAVLVVSGFFVWLWAWSSDNLTRALAFDIASMWIAVAMAAAGTFGLIKAATTSSSPNKGEKQS